MLKEANLAANILKSNVGRLGFPYKLTFAVTGKCNSRCLSCGIWRKKPDGELTSEEIKTFFRKSSGFNWVDVTGGEIFLRNDIADILKSIIDNCKRLYNLHFPTNGLLTDRVVACAREIVKKKPPKLIVTVSLDGPPKVHDRLRGVPGGWEKAVETFRQLKTVKGVEVYFGMTLSNENAGLFQETLGSVRGELPGVTSEDFHMNIAHTSAHYYSNEIPAGGLRKDEIVNEVERFRKLKGINLNPVFYLENRYLKSVKDYLKEGVTPLPCKAASVSCFISPDGTVYPCSIWDKPLGNLKEVDYEFRRIWNAPDFRQAAADAHSKRCPNCWTPCEAYQTLLGNALNPRVFL
ncbi:MAG: radical SAM protein [Candidatus Altiarchaeota archaeon]